MSFAGPLQEAKTPHTGTAGAPSNRGSEPHNVTNVGATE